MTSNKNMVILVNEHDEWTGTMEKLQAHQEGALHRAFSVFVLNSKNELLLQQRAISKYHSAGLWSNTCCSHPMPGESTLAGAGRRLEEEMGFTCKLQPTFTMRYRAEVGNNLVENEYDHIYVGHFDGNINANADEVKDYKFLPLEEVQQWMTQEPQVFTTWFHLAFPKFVAHLQLEDQAA
jgi:isopentenyl-diphosphate delta-isomerase